MVRVAHLVAALALLVAHGAFLGRGLYLRRTGRGPAALDRAARSASQLLLPLCAFLGLLRFSSGTSPLLVLHLLLGLAPLAAILLVFAGRMILRRRTEAPWLLPALNMALIAAAMASGFAVSGG